MSDLNSSPKGVIYSPWKLFGGKSKRSTAKLKNGNNMEPKTGKVGMIRTLSKIKEQEETVFLQIQSKINPSPSFDVIRTISVQDDNKKKKKKKKNSSKKSNQKKVTKLNEYQSDSVKSQSQHSFEEMFHNYHEKLHRSGHRNQRPVNIVNESRAMGQQDLRSSDASNCLNGSDGSIYSSSDYDDEDEESCASSSSEESFAEYTVDSSMSSVTVPVPVRTDSVTTSELFSYFSACAADAAAKLGTMCICGDEEEDVQQKENIASKLPEIAVPIKSKK